MSSNTRLMKLEHLRKLMKNVNVNGRLGIEAYIITSDDAHQSEYIRDCDKRREFISGFKGSFGTAVVTHHKALLLTDGRYYNQASLELDPRDSWILMKESAVSTPTIEDWLINNLPVKSVVGGDPHLISNATWKKLQTALVTAGHVLVPIEENLVDEVWGSDRPMETLNEIVPHAIIYSGKLACEKVQQCFNEMEKLKVNMLVLSALDEIAYLLNWRGSDIPYNPVFIAYVVLFLNQVHIFTDEQRINFNAKKQLKEEKVDFIIHPYQDIKLFLKNKIDLDFNHKIWLSNNSSYSLHRECSRAAMHVAITPVCLMKLIKNEAEIVGMKSAHIRDAVALTKYFSWLENKIKNLTENDVSVTEVSAAEQLEKFRKEEDKYIGPSFPTISAFGKHGAIIHYRPSVETDVPINCQELYLCDTGAHFLDGTTDVTRTFHFGQPSDYERECYTRVFKGQCNVAMSIFPSMIKGNYLDTLARKHLWKVGLDYLHGTGHGVGAYLNVHELPTMISWKPYPDDPGLQAGMILSNEPGYYEDEHFGIRLENVELVIEATTKYKRFDGEFLTFDTITLVPIQTKLLDLSMLTNEEISFLNNYHAKCYAVLEPYLQGPENMKALLWLKKATEIVSN